MLRPETVKPAENILREMFHGISLGNDLMNMTLKTHATKAKTDKWGLYQTKNILRGKGNNQQSEKVPFAQF